MSLTRVWWRFWNHVMVSIIFCVDNLLVLGYLKLLKFVFDCWFFFYIPPLWQMTIDQASLWLEIFHNWMIGRFCSQNNRNKWWHRTTSESILTYSQRQRCSVAIIQHGFARNESVIVYWNVVEVYLCEMIATPPRFQRDRNAWCGHRYRRHR